MCFRRSLVIVLAVAGLVFVRNTPQEKGLNPDNVSDEVYKKEYFNEETGKDGGWTAKKLFKMKGFWMIAVASGGFQFVSTVIITQLVVRNMELGFTQGQATMIMTILAFAGILGSWIIGAMDQKLGTKKTMIFFGIWYAAALFIEVTEIPALRDHLPDHVCPGSGRIRQLYHIFAGSGIRPSRI